MLTIATLLDTDSDFQTKEIWSELENACNLSEIKLLPIPHFSWQSAESYDLPKVYQCISERCENLLPFPIIFSGIGLFLDPFPVIYLRMVVTETILNLHARLWNDLNPLSKNRNKYYQPGLWQPHITIAYGDVDYNKIGCAFKNLFLKELRFKIIMDNISILYNIDGDAGINRKFEIAK